MAKPEEIQHTRKVRTMFGQIAQRYDLLNRVMTFGQDIRWRKEAIRKLELKSGPQWVLDAGTGTGDIALAIQKQYPQAVVVASDLTPEMILVGKKRTGAEKIHWVIADAMDLPFAQEAFDGVISGYLLRNVPDVNGALREQCRVLKPLKAMVSLDTTPPADNLLKPFIGFFLHRVIPLMGKILTGHTEAYTYLPDTTEHFLPADKLAARMEAVGFWPVQFCKRMFGTMAIHFAVKNPKS